MTQKHTPAPWEIYPGSYAGYNKKDICTVYGVERMPTEDGLGETFCTIIGREIDKDWTERKYHETGSANARLIAAAPTMLDALWSVLPKLSHGSPEWQIVHDAIDKASS